MLQTPLQNYWTPLASQVEELDEMPPQLNLLLLIQQHPPRRVTFALSPFHVDKDSTWWQQGCPPNKHTTFHINPLTALNHMHTSILNGTIPSAVSNTGATLSAFLKLDPSFPTGRVSTLVFHLPDGAVALATTVNKLLHEVRTPARDVNIVPSLVGYLLLSTSKFAAAGYTAVYDKDKVNFYDARTTKITVLEDAVLKGWQCPCMNL